MGNSQYQGLPIEKIGKGFGVLALAFDAYNIADSIKKGDYASAGFSGASAVGGALMIFGGPVGVGVGAVIVGASIIGELLWTKHENSVKYESDGARAFLQGAGINPDLANELINNDSDGRSPAPVFTALAEKLGVDPKEYFDYLSKLPPDRAKQLMEYAHGVDPDDKGVYPVNKDGGFDNDLGDIAYWMINNGFAVAPGISTKDKGIYTPAFYELTNP